MASKPPKVRLVKCPKCFKLLPEWASLPVYQCGGCGTTLKAKMRVEDQEGESSAVLPQISAQMLELENGCENDKELSSSQKATVRSSDGREQIDYQEKSSEGGVSYRSASPREPELHGSNKSLSIEGNTRPDEHYESGSDLGTPRPDNVQSTSGGSNSTITSPKPFVENVSPKLKASPVKELEKSETIVVRRYADLIGARGTGKTAEATDDSIVSEDDRVGVSKPPTTKSFHASDDSVVSEDDRVGVSKPPTTKSLHASDDSMISEDDTVGVSKPPTTKSLHAYDASISSNDGWGDPGSNIHSYRSKRSSFGSEKLPELADPGGWADQRSNIHSHRSKSSSFRSEKLPEVADSDGGSTREDVPVNNKITVYSELNNRARKFSSLSLNERHDPVSVESSSLGQDVSPENTRYSIEDHKQVHSRDSAITSPAQNWLEVERRELKNEKRSKDSSAVNRNKDPSKYRHKKAIPPAYSPQNIVSAEQNHMELVRKVDELREQLNRSYDINVKANEWFPTNGNQQERPCPLYYSQNLPDHNMLLSRDVNLPPRRSPGRYVPSKSLPFQGGYYKMPHSGNIIHHGHHVNCLCLDAYREDWQCLQQFPPYVCYNEMLSRPYPDHVYYNYPYGSSSSSPEPHLQSRYPLQYGDVNTSPYNSHIDKDRDLENLHRKERRPSVIKKHCLPIAGGAPLVMCHHCQKLLHLPADSFLPNKRSHRLQCGSCSKVLTFSLRKGTHLAPYPQHPDIPTRREVYASSASSSMRNSAAAYNNNGNPLGDPVSFSEDYGRSTFKSGSTETGTYAINTKQLLSRLNESVKRSGNKQKKVMHASDSDSDDRLRKELLQKATGPTLHQLMGYPSPSRVLNGD